MTSSDIPPFLRLSQEERNASWRDNPPRQMPLYHEPRRDEDEATKLLREQIAAADKAQTYARLHKAGFV